jgi:hypothetical protein
MRRDEADGKMYRYYQYSASAAAVAASGKAVYAATTDGVVTDDISTTSINMRRGIAVGAIAKGSYGWFQVWGNHPTVKTDGGDDVAIGAAIIGSLTTDGAVNSVAVGTAPTNAIFGWAAAADVDASNTVSVDLCIG